MAASRQARKPWLWKRTRWLSGKLAHWEIVTKIVVCDPRENYLISRSARKENEADAKTLARLLRLGGVKEVYQTENDHRALFKQAAGYYTDMRDQQRALKQKNKSRLKRGDSGIGPIGAGGPVR